MKPSTKTRLHVVDIALQDTEEPVTLLNKEHLQATAYQNKNKESKITSTDNVVVSLLFT